MLATYATAYHSIDIYTTQPGKLLGDPTLQFSLLYTIYPIVDGSAPGYQNLNLFTESVREVQTPYLLGFRFKESPNEDWLDLLKLDLDNLGYNMAQTRHVKLEVLLFANF